jgi:hypothetical protein
MIYNITNPNYTIDEENLARLKEDFERVSEYSKPKLVRLNDAFHHYNLVDVDHPTLHFAKGLLEHGHREPIEKATFMEKMNDQKDNVLFHAVKCMFLIHEELMRGFYSLPQAYINHDTGKWVVHPGSFRVKTLVHTGKWEQNFIVWDDKDILEEDPIDFDTWCGHFLHNAEFERDLHVAVEPQNHRGKKSPIIEFHVGEDREMMYTLARKVHNRFKVKPYLKGECHPDLEIYFSDDPTSKIHVTTAEGYVLQEHDLVHFLNLHPTIRDFNTDRVFISSN